MTEPDRPRARGDDARDRTDYEKGLPDHHDPTAGISGAPPAQSALTLRLVLATFGLVVCAVLAVLGFLAEVPLVFPIALAVLAVVALVDLMVVARRKLRGEPG